MKKLFLTLALVLTLVLALAACNDGDSDHVHAYGNWVTIKEATSQETGIRVRRCTCGEQITETIPATQNGDNDNSGNGDESSHTHTYDQKNTATTYRKSAATCQEAAVYY